MHFRKAALGIRLLGSKTLKRDVEQRREACPVGEPDEHSHGGNSSREHDVNR